MIVIDNYFDNPDSIREFALDKEFYTKETHPGNIGNFPGLRTNYINELDNNLYNLLVQEELANVSKLENLNHYKEYWCKFSFSYTTKGIGEQLHRDFVEGHDGYKKFYGGIVYLNPNPPKKSGTIVVDEQTVENVYNRYVMYDATKEHGIESSFGKEKTSARLVLTHFIYLK